MHFCSSAYASKCLIIILLDNMKTVISQEEIFLLSVNICFFSKDISSQSLRNHEKNAEGKLSILCPFNKNCDMTSRTSTYSIFKSNVIQWLMVRMK